MKKSFTLARVGVQAFIFSLISLTIHAQLPAFPGAEGFGKFATGGRTGSVYHVTNLNNSGTGSLRDAVSAPNRIVVFDVAGVIKITERMVVSANIYIAGQTAPGEGITVYGNGWSFSNAHNTICRYMRIRMGNGGTSGADAIGIADGKNMIFDHCSVSWGRDETFSINSSTSENITIQNCIISQGLLSHSAGGLIQAPGGITLYRNVYADNGTRNNKIKGVNQYVNNLVYNWQSGAYIMGGDSQGESFANAISNMFIAGPIDGVAPFSVGNSLYHIYQTDNLHDSARNGVLDPYVIQPSEFGGGPDFQASPYAYPTVPTMPAANLFANLLPTVGATLPYRDYADYYVINEVKSLGKKGELIAKEDVLPFGAPTAWPLWTGTARTDTDNDGMPDAWENANGLNPNSAADAMAIAANSYTNIENYINGIDAAYSQDYLRSPMNLRQDSATQSTIYLSWFDYTEKETGFVVERKVDGVFVQIGTTGVNENFFAVTGLQPEEKDTFRVKAINAGGSSGYSNELIAKSKPIEVPVLDPNTFVPDLTWSGSVNGDWDKVTNNWLSSGSPAAFADSSKLLFGEAGVAGQTINITAQMGPKDMLINSAGNYTFSGAGNLAGPGSLNKMGAGKLVVNAGNNFTGAAVLRAGTMEFSQLQNGGVASSIGASANYGFNWVWKGGTWNYTGGNTATDRNAVIDNSTEFSVANAASSVTFNGSLSGVGGLIKAGPGKLTLRSINTYEGETVIKGGVLEVTPLSVSTEAEDIIHNGVALGSSNVIRFEGGTFRTSSGSTTIYENYPMRFIVKEGTVNSFEPYRNANLMMDVSGSGTLNYAITYSRELIQGDWTGFTGRLLANGVGTLTGGERSMLMMDNGVGMPNTLVTATGITKIASYQNAQTLYLGGLSGTSGTSLSCGNKTAGGVLTWAVGAANTNETFDGIINNEAYGSATAMGTTSIIKEGDGIWRLTNTNIYSGTTTITAGALVVNGNHTGTGAVTVTAGALAGIGSITGDVTVEAGAIEPGDSSVGTLTLKGNVTLQGSSSVNADINKTNGTADKLKVNGNLVYAGVLSLNITGTLASGDAFTLFEPGGATSGNFSSIVPAEPGPGLQWLFTPATGVLKVVQPGFVETPTNLVLTPGVIAAPAAVFVDLSWNDNSDNEIHFVIERSEDSVSFTEIAQAAANATTYRDQSGLTENKKYYYRVKAQGSIAASAYTAIKGVTTLAMSAAPDKPTSPAPAHLAENVIANNGKVSLAWSGSGNTVTYSVYFGTDSTALSLLGDVAYSASPTIETGTLAINTWYYWRVNATNANGTTTGTVWAFKVAGVPAVATGDYRSAASGNWGTSTVATTIWETFDGANWVATADVPTSAATTITIKNGHTVTLNATTAITNLVVENGATLKSGGDGLGGAVANRNLRVRNSVANFGTLGSSSTSAERVSLEMYKDNGNITLAGTSTYYVVNFSVNTMALVLNVDLDANMNLSGYIRSYGSQAPTGTPSQDDDDVTININAGKTVTMGSSGYLQAGSSPTTNTFAQFGKYTFNIKGRLDMRSTGTSCIVAHSTIAASSTTINVSGLWQTGNAMRLVSSATTIPVGGISLNITGNGIVDAGARTAGGSTATNLVHYNSTTKQVIPFMTSDNGQLKTRVTTSDVTFHVGSAGVYTPVKLNNSGTADIIGVNVKDIFDYPVADTMATVRRQYKAIPATPATTNLAISLGWMPLAQGSAFNPAGPLVHAQYDGSGWAPTDAVVSGAGTSDNPYYARVSGYTNFAALLVANQGASLPINLLSFTAKAAAGQVQLQWQTASQHNGSHFVLQRSTNGAAFEEVARVAVVGQLQTYFHTDAPKTSGQVYYRLQMVDKDGSFEYSKVVVVMLSENTLLTAYPNPVPQRLQVLHGAGSSIRQLQVFNASGVQVIRQQIPAGTTSSILPVQHLAAGWYTLQCGTQTLKFMKQ